MLDKYYDLILGDLEGMEMYADFLKKHSLPTSLLEFACGTGDLIGLTQDYFSHLIGVDLSTSMITQAQSKFINPHISFVVGDMMTYQTKADTVVCFGDSLNYLLEKTEVETFVKNSSECALDCILIDCHHPSRLMEFSEGYEEDGQVEEIDYSWHLQSQGEYLIHQFNFYGTSMSKEEVIQRVYDPQWVGSLYETLGWQVNYWTDFVYPGIEATGEKVFLEIRRYV